MHEDAISNLKCKFSDVLVAKFYTVFICLKLAVQANDAQPPPPARQKRKTNTFFKKVFRSWEFFVLFEWTGDMYSLFRMSHPPTGVEHSVEACFFGRWERNLVVAGANVLRVFRYGKRRPSYSRQRPSYSRFLGLQATFPRLEEWQEAIVDIPWFIADFVL